MKQPFCTPAQALRRVLDAAAALPVPATERVPLDDACGRIAARDLCARMDQPPFDRSPLDGYALHSADTAGAGEKTPVTLPVQETDRICFKEGTRKGSVAFKLDAFFILSVS